MTRQLCDQVIRIAELAGNFIAGEQNKIRSGDIEYKGFNDLVSYVDREAERMIVEGLAPLIPGAGFLTEENTIRQASNQFRWVIDPIDGTTNFLHGVPCYCVSIALLENSELMLGVIYEINLDERFYAWKGSPAYLNGQTIRVTTIPQLNKSLLATGFPYNNFERVGPYMEVFDYLMKHTHGLRRLGSAAVDLAYVAAGRFEGFYEYGLNPWDVAAGAFIVQQAGGKVSDFSGGPGYLFEKEIIACNYEIFDELQGIVSSIFYR
ncbi:MAG: inositol monophosphatase [Bacteroidia bacterium]|nr:inositol monophosphatase [Bacteroidia bacterium]MCZ2276878.1 inositol monophosphatase [Bacteroidia bacterium]